MSSETSTSQVDPQAEEFERKRQEARQALQNVEVGDAQPVSGPVQKPQRARRPRRSAPPDDRQARAIVSREVAEQIASRLSSEKFMVRVSALLRPLGIDPQRWVKIALGTVMRDEKLMIAAKTNPAGLLHALTRAAEMGLDPSGACAEAYLVPFWNSKRGCYDIQLIIGYNGLRKLARRYGGIVDARAHLVYEKDQIEVELGSDEEKVRHSFDPKKPRGKIVGAYCKIWRRCGDKLLCFVEYMTREEIDAVRRRSKAADSGPWVTDYGEMARKCVTRRGLKQFVLAPDSASGRAAVMTIHDDEDYEDQDLIVQLSAPPSESPAEPGTAGSEPPPADASAPTASDPSGPQDQTDTPELPF